MPPKSKLPLPVDRPLSRAYLREFSGWSTAFPPGLSDPTSLRLMENVQINRDGSARVRPGLRYLSFTDLPVYDEDGTLVTPGTQGDGVCVGTHETFFLNNGNKAYLYAVREDDGTIGFRVLTSTDDGQVVHELDAPGVDFTFDPDYASLCFSAETTYVKFLQIDNKIFALSNAGEPMREFFVGEEKRAKLLRSIERPNWAVADKLDVVHPDASWITAATPTGYRYNLSKYGSFEAAVDYNALASFFGIGELTRSNTFFKSGSNSLKLESSPEKTNYHPRPLGDPDANGHAGWTLGINAVQLTDDPIQGLIVLADNTAPVNTEYRVFGPSFDLAPNADFKMAVSLGASLALGSFGMIVRYFNSSGTQIGGDRVFTAAGVGAGRKIYSATSPSGTRSCRIIFWGKKSGGGASWFSVSKVTVVDDIHPNTFFDGDSGASYYWTGAANNSTSVYHPPQDVYYLEQLAGSIDDYTVSAEVRAGTVVRQVQVGVIGGSMSVAANDAVGAWTNFNHSWAQASASLITVGVVVKAIPRGESHYLDEFMIERVAVPDTYFNGATPNVVGELYTWDGAAHQSSSKLTEYVGANTPPTAETPTADTLIATTGNDYSFGFFYSFSNEIGESAVSQSTVVRMKRPWSGWAWETPDVNGEPSGTGTLDPILCADQLVAIMPEAVWDDAVSAGAVKWTLFGFTWSDQDPVPVDAVKIAEREITDTSSYDEDGWIQVTPAVADVGSEAAPLPSLAGRFNYSDPSRAGQGLVAADRMILVFDPTQSARIRWSSNQQGSYTDFTARRGGGYKTLTSGNLMIPAAVKLWQNPQSVDTLTVLCLGVDGHSTGYYMAPATVQALSDAVEVMAFEETTATPGTTSPYGVEVLNNALFHPLDNELMKSTANNYNISHKTQTEQIENMWRGLLTKHKIVSSQHDNRLYFIVNNPEGANLEDDCMGNEIWVFDTGKEGGSWSRWLIQAVSLRKVEQNGNVHMSVVRPDGIYYLDDQVSTDDFVDGDGNVQSRPIPWLLETNTQGANRAHDAMCNLQQANVVVGNFQGVMRYGVRGWDRHGKPFDVSKVVGDNLPPGTLPFDLEDYMLVRKHAKEWFFYASSVEDQHSAGQISLVQYRYTPLSVNDGYEYGSVETFDYGRVEAGSATQITTNGTPQPMIDVRRP